MDGLDYSFMDRLDYSLFKFNQREEKGCLSFQSKFEFILSRTLNTKWNSVCDMADGWVSIQQ